MSIKALFLDIGGVLLSDGWDRYARKRAAKHFDLDPIDLDDRHHLNFATLEEGKITFDEYLGRVAFYTERSFTKAEFRDFMFTQSTAHPEMIELVKNVKSKYGLKVIVVSNESRELSEFRIQKFDLGQFVDAFICSCFVHVRKPDPDIFRLALDITQVNAEEVLYIENTAMFVQVAESMGIKSICHTDYVSTRERLSALGLPRDV